MHTSPFSGLGRDNGSWQLQNSCMSGIALKQVSLINAALPRAWCLLREQAPVPTLAWAEFKEDGSGLGNVRPQVTLSIVSGLGVFFFFSKFVTAFGKTSVL